MQKKTAKKIKLLPYQSEFLHDESRYVALVAGLGTGKTKAATYKALHLLQINKGCDGIGCEPTGPQLSIFTTEMNKTCQELGIKYNFNGGGRNSPAFYEFDMGYGPQKLWLVSAENWRRTLVGYNVSWGFIDEFDTIPDKDDAVACWNALNDRIRDPRAKLRQAFCTTTPEGYKQVVEVFAEEVSPDGLVTKAKPNHKVYQVATSENIFLSPKYKEDQLRRYTPTQAQAKFYGRFVNAYGHRVYDCFDRTRNATELTINDFPANSILHVGMDFNVGAMSAVISIVQGGRVYTVEEIIGPANTDAMVKELKSRYPGRTVYVYPDSSGKNRAASADGASVSSISKLQAAGFQCFFKGNNPSIVKERVPAVNALYLNALGESRAFVNITQCPQLVKGLEQQQWKDGKPDKSSGLDHSLDAYGYFCHFRYPVQGQGSISVYN
ncbi:terminase large subunit domain-containing protein [Leptothrix discophora]|uniref:Terminase family protein n=1 Tax=Leptothrix discophora TaxID=89 RepID=A0ABT9G0A9_LEPDI|nr:terminase family protein [Leptothrix discophora]MDP4299919.1 terminase family protein [Leptothrix discophora]